MLIRYLAMEDRNAYFRRLNTQYVPTTNGIPDYYHSTVRMFRAARIQITSSTICTQQFGRHEWLMNRDMLPPTAASRTHRRLRVKHQIRPFR